MEHPTVFPRSADSSAEGSASGFPSDLLSQSARQSVRAGRSRRRSTTSWWRASRSNPPTGRSRQESCRGGSPRCTAPTVGRRNTRKPGGRRTGHNR